MRAYRGRANVASEEQERLVAVLVAELAARPEIAFAFLHGSFTAGGPFRDLDVAVYFDAERVSPDQLRDYEAGLAIALEEKVMFPVDVRVLNDAPVSFRYHAIKGRLLVARDGNVADEFRARTWDDYCDFAPFARRYLREALNG
jgi:predicted nucleotidyltransferase